MKIIFAGTPPIARTVLSKILDSGFIVDLVLTKPDSKANRGKLMTYSVVKELAIARQIPVFQPNTFKNNPDAVAYIRKLNPDIIIVVAYGLILPQDVLDIPSLGCVNIHVSLLPKYRGAAPIQRALLNNEQESGVTVMQMDASLDTGDILLQRSIKLDPKETSASLHDKLAIMGADMIVEYLRNYQNIIRIKQGDIGISYAAKIEKAEAKINWQECVTLVERKIRGFNPFPIAFTYLNGELLKIWQAVIDNSKTTLQPGTIISANADGICVSCGSGQVLRILELQLAGRTRQFADSFILGQPNLVNQVCD